MRAPSHAPAVRYPHGRSAVVGWLLLAVAGCGLTSLLGWLVPGTAQADLAIKAASGLGLGPLAALRRLALVAAHAGGSIDMGWRPMGA